MPRVVHEFVIDYATAEEVAQDNKRHVDRHHFQLIVVLETHVHKLELGNEGCHHDHNENVDHRVSQVENKRISL